VPRPLRTFLVLRDQHVGKTPPDLRIAARKRCRARHPTSGQ
jgi:hypothetical protein